MKPQFIETSLINKRLMNRIFIGSIILLELILLSAIVLIAFRLCHILTDENNNGKELYSLIAMGLMLLWIGVLVAYYAWAIYFYNINLGLTNQDWAEIRERKQYLPEGEMQLPTENPNAVQTLGLPPGTLRGTIALTLLVCSIALAIASLGMDSNVKVNTFLVDNFDFFKTAFLMMIAFYFGNKALESIGYKSQKTINGSQQSNPEPPTGGSPATSAPRSAVVENAASVQDKLQANSTSINPDKADNDFENPEARG